MSRLRHSIFMQLIREPDREADGRQAPKAAQDAGRGELWQGVPERERDAAEAAEHAVPRGRHRHRLPGHHGGVRPIVRALPAPVLAVCPLQTLPDWWTPCFYRRACKCRAALERRDPPWCAGLLIWLDLVAADSISSLRGLHIASALRLCTCCRGGLILYRAVLSGSQLQGSAVLDIGEPVRDYARVGPY